ncbi:COX15/CtaA family protein [Enterovibrio paralichthyis]|uniref:COX15/CtaA family protein n=1 Tax=Enterovibrio paralichthyis TaxID=2853805 RepID=UPI001C462EEB|nr:COX15/CtaA family protein [Enterovibrio paralichthyis]MBV7298692.1 COX15/CtaA family protein [Enterovibrio paralichthyis]
MEKEKRYLALIYGALLLSVIVVGLGAYTRLTEAGLGCPDWPGCYGFLTVPHSEEKIAKATEAFPHAPVEVHKAWNEMIHRYVAGTLGLVIAAIAVLAWRVPGRYRLLPTLLVGVVCFQAALGMWTVTMNLMPVVVMGHLLGGFTTVTLLFLLALMERRRIDSTIQQDGDAAGRPAIGGKLKALSLAALLAVVMQIALGGWTSANYAALVCTQLPVCEVDWVEKYDLDAFHPVSPENHTYQYGVLGFDQRVTIHATHRLGAMLVTALVLLLAVAVKKPLGSGVSWMLGAALALQITLGVTNVVAYLPLPVAVAHNLGGLLLLLVTVRTVLGVFSSQFVPSGASSFRDTGRLSHG